MAIFSTLIGLCFASWGSLVFIRGPSDIQIGIGATFIIGGVILIFIGAIFDRFKTISSQHREMLNAMEDLRAKPPAPAAPQSLELSASELSERERRLSAMSPGRFAD